VIRTRTNLLRVRVTVVLEVEYCLADSSISNCLSAFRFQSLSLVPAFTFPTKTEQYTVLKSPFAMIPPTAQLAQQVNAS